MIELSRKGDRRGEILEDTRKKRRIFRARLVKTLGRTRFCINIEGLTLKQKRGEFFFLGKKR
jgi:hypothetical protein